MLIKDIHKIKTGVTTLCAVAYKTSTRKDLLKIENWARLVAQIENIMDKLCDDDEGNILRDTEYNEYSCIEIIIAQIIIMLAAHAEFNELNLSSAIEQILTNQKKD